VAKEIATFRATKVPVAVFDIDGERIVLLVSRWRGAGPLLPSMVPRRAMPRREYLPRQRESWGIGVRGAGPPLPSELLSCWWLM